MTKPFRAIVSFFKDLKHVGRLGPAFLLRHPMAMAGRETCVLPIAGVGVMQMRYNNSDAAVVRQIFSRREYDLSKYPQRKRLQAAYEGILAKGEIPLIIDAGANIGAASIWFAKEFPSSIVVAVEPDAGNIELCRRNLAAHEQVRLVAGAIGATSGRVDLENPTGESYAIRTTRAEAGSTRVYTVQELVAEAGEKAALLLVKVDIEGFEADLFSQNVDWLDDASALIVELHDWMLPGQHASRSLQRAIFPRDFEMLIHRESLVFIR